MPIDELFAEDYAAARIKFRTAAEAAGAALHAYEHPSQRGPSGEKLSIDVAVVGASAASRCLLLISGTHGVEGFAGSGCQVGFFRDSWYGALDRNTCAVVVHALNPYGFAWIRRVNEDNVDLNRNFQDFTKALPRNDEYDALHALLMPSEWEGPARVTADTQLQEFGKQHGLAALQAAISGGQYTQPDGLFFGGLTETWSSATFKQIIGTLVPQATTRLVTIDIHTGLGPVAYGEPIVVGGSEGQNELAKARFGAEVKTLTSGESASAILTGTLANAFDSWRADRDITFLGLEFGTKPVADVLAALRGDHWLHSAQNRDSPLRPKIKSAIRDAFYVDAPYWRAAVYGRTADIVCRAARVLGAP
jgi:uncharacterized protein DUF2817